MLHAYYNFSNTLYIDIVCTLFHTLHHLYSLNQLILALEQMFILLANTILESGLELNAYYGCCLDGIAIEVVARGLRAGS